MKTAVFGRRDKIHSICKILCESRRRVATRRRQAGSGWCMIIDDCLWDSFRSRPFRQIEYDFLSRKAAFVVL